jgi:hypothetical protein
MKSGEVLLKVIEDSLEWERVNGEVIVISFSSGKYFSLSGPAADVWHLLLRGINPAGLLEVLSESWLKSDLASDEIMPFVEDCLKEGLVAETGTEEVMTITELPNDLNRSNWTTPFLMTFGNLKDLIMVDPVHDSSLINWPLPGDAKH